MDCFTSPTIRLSAPCDSPSSKRSLKLPHCIRLVSWNSSIITLRMFAPIFSKTKEESPSLTSWWSRAFVSDNRNRLLSRFNWRTSSSILASNCTLLRCCMDSRQLFIILLFFIRNISACTKSGIRLSVASCKISL